MLEPRNAAVIYYIHSGRDIWCSGMLFPGEKGLNIHSKDYCTHIHCQPVCLFGVSVWIFGAIILWWLVVQYHHHYCSSSTQIAAGLTNITWFKLDTDRNELILGELSFRFILKFINWTALFEYVIQYDERNIGLSKVMLLYRIQISNQNTDWQQFYEPFRPQ